MLGASIQYKNLHFLIAVAWRHIAHGTHLKSILQVLCFGCAYYSKAIYLLSVYIYVSIVLKSLYNNYKTFQSA